MKTNRNVCVQLAMMLFVVLTSTTSMCVAGDFLYASTTDTLSYRTYIGPIPITGLSLTLPAAGKYFNTAVVTLNMPNLFLSKPTSKMIPMAVVSLRSAASTGRSGMGQRWNFDRNYPNIRFTVGHFGEGVGIASLLAKS